MPRGVGLEIGDSAVRAAVIERQGGASRLVAAAEAPWTGESPAGLLAALKQLRKAVGATPGAVLGIPTSWTIVTTVQPLVVVPQRAALAIEFELQQHLPYRSAQAVWAYQWIGSRARAAARPVVVAATKRAVLEERLEVCRQAGWSIKAVTVGAVAAANAWAREAGPNPGPARLLGVTENSLEWIAVQPDGVHVLAAPRDPAEPIDAQLDASWAQVQEAAGLGSDAPPLWLLADGDTLGLETALHERVSGPIKRLEPPALGAARAQPPPAGGRFAVAYGLALQGGGDVWLPINLLGAMQGERAAQTLGRAALAVGALCLLAALAVTGGSMWRLLSSRRAALAEVVRHERLYKELRPELRGHIQRQAQLDARIRQLEDLAARRSLLGEAVQRVAESLPDDAWLSMLHVTKQDRRLLGEFEGYATSFQGVNRFIDQLKSGVGWSTVKLAATTVTPDQTTGKELVAFAVHSEHPIAAVGAEPAEPAAAPPAEPAARPVSGRKPAAKTSKKTGSKKTGSKKTGATR